MPDFHSTEPDRSDRPNKTDDSFKPGDFYKGKDSVKPPTRLFKFVDSVEAVRAMCDGQLKFAPFYELNDPSEGADVHNSEAFERSLQPLLVQGYTDEQFNCLLAQFQFAKAMKIEGLEDIPTDIKSAQKRLIKEFESINKNDTATAFRDILTKLAEKLRGNLNFTKDDYALHYFCLTKRYDSLPMWSHYANRSQGFVVIFKNLHKYFDAVEPWAFNGLHKVVYVRKRPPLTYDPLSFANLFLAKTDDWSYEEEYRIVKPRHELNIIIPPKSQGATPPSTRIYCYQIDKTKFKDEDAAIIDDIIIGENAEDKDKEFLIALRDAQPDNEKINLFQAHTENDGHVSLKAVTGRE